MSQRNKRILEDEEETKVVQKAMDESIKEYMLIATTLNHGLRNSEAVRLRRKHIDLDKNTLTVIDGKGGKDRLIPIPSQFQNEFQYYFKEKDLDSGEDFLFPSRRRNHHLSPRAFEMKMRHYAVECGLYPDGTTYESVAEDIPYRERIVPHSLRHTYATRLLREGEPMAKVSRLLGHESVQVTVDVYGHLNIEDLRDTVEVMT
jgi:integrase/recombinase XerD